MPAKKVTLSVIKADVGSIGGHTKPSDRMLSRIAEYLRATPLDNIVDHLVTFTGDDIALIFSHEYGVGSKFVHALAWNCFKEATSIARQQGCYGAGQDLLVDAPSGNLRGAGPAVAEIEFALDFSNKNRPAEAFMLFAADKCGPGAYNYPLYSTFCDPMHNGGLLLNPKLHQGFTITVIDMDNKDGDRVIKLDVPERSWDVAALLQNPDRFAIEAVHSRYRPDEQIVSVSATRLHNIAGKYTGKDDPIALVRTQGMFPAPEEVVEPYTLGHFLTGDCRGSHVMPIMPVAIRTPVAGPYCLPIVSCLAFSMNAEGKFSDEYADLFGDGAWDEARVRIQAKAHEWRRQGFIGPTMASHAELAYTGIVDTLEALDEEFSIRP